MISGGLTVHELDLTNDSTLSEALVPADRDLYRLEKNLFCRHFTAVLEARSHELQLCIRGRRCFVLERIDCLSLSKKMYSYTLITRYG